MSDEFIIDGKKYSSRLFHCFGHEDSKLDLDVAVGLITKSGTNFITFNTQDINSISNKEEFKLGFSNVSLKELSKRINLNDYVLLNNINHAINAEEAINRARKASAISGSKMIKLEVLNSDRKTSNDEEVIKAARVLAKEGYKVMTLCSCDEDVVRQLEEAGCILIRIIGSPIRSLNGLVDTETAKKIFKSAKIPVIVDGGIGVPQHAIDSMKLGASGILVNAALFASKDPVGTVELMKDAVISGRKLYLKKKVR